MLAYLDHAASGPLHPTASAAMLPWITGRFGNPSGSHQVSRHARAAIDDARDLMAALIGAEPGGITLTSGGTESNNLAVLGVLTFRPGPAVVSAVEHPAVIEAALASGQEIRIAPVRPDGAVDLDGLSRLLDPAVSLVSVQLANHETGVVQAFADIARVVRRRAPRAVLHTDAVAATPWVDLSALTAPADLVSVSAHKFGGPQGAGALAARRGIEFRPILHGGGQEHETRSGTHNVAAVVGMGAAAKTLMDERTQTTTRVAALRDELQARIVGSVGRLAVTAPSAQRLPGHIHLRVLGIESESLLILLDDGGVCASAGAACASGAIEPSPVLLAMGIPKAEALSSLRLTLGWSTTRDEIEHAAAVIASATRTLRGVSG